MKLQSDALTTRVCTILVQHSDSPELTPEDVQPSAPIFGPGGIIADSLAVLDAICEIEAALDIGIPDEDLTEELFASLQSLVTYLRSRTKGTKDV